MLKSPILFVASCFTVFAGVSSGTMSQSEKDDMLKLHNLARSKVSNAADMTELVWDSTLESNAQQFANTCPSDHAQGINEGENLAWGWPTLPVASAMNGWVEEELPYFRYSYPKWCQGGIMKCGHYSQIIWAKTSRLGCARRSGCPMGSSTGDIYVCRYKEQGNIYGNRPYKTGTKCTACPSGYSTCKNSLCSTSSSSSSGSSTTSCPAGQVVVADFEGNGQFDKTCTFPFTYGGKVHNGCTSEGWTRPWCALSTGWGNCGCINNQCPAGRTLVADTKANGVYSNRCSFPFTYNGKQYNSCTREGYDKYWCYLSDGNWGVCACVG